jgi:DNA-binding transcriptional LysR family regulator
MDTLDALRLYVSIADAGNLTAAARQQSVATSTVTVALQQLEAEAGAALITRSTRRLAFTYEGRQFLADARRILADWDLSIGGVKEGPLKGPIRMTSTEDFGRRELVPLIDKFMAIHPGVVIALHLHDGVVDLVEHNLDLALRNGPLSDSTLKARVVLRGRRVICASPAYWDAHGRPSHPTDLTKHNCLVVFRPSAPFGTWSFVVDGKPLAVRVSGNRIVNDGGVLRHWAKAGYGVTIRVAWDIQRELERGELETVLDEFMPDNANLYAVTAGGISSRRVRTFIDYLVEEFLKLERPLGLEDLA